MAENTEASDVLRELWARIDAQDWDGLAGLLDPGLTAHYTHTGENFSPDELVRLNREYPGRWHVDVEDLIGEGARAVSLARVSDGTRTHHVASFATVRGGLVTELVEVWAESGVPVPDDRR